MTCGATDPTFLGTKNKDWIQQAREGLSIESSPCTGQIAAAVPSVLANMCSKGLLAELPVLSCARRMLGLFRLNCTTPNHCQMNPVLGYQMISWTYAAACWCTDRPRAHQQNLRSSHERSAGCEGRLALVRCQLPFACPCRPTHLNLAAFFQKLTRGRSVRHCHASAIQHCPEKQKS